MRRFPLVAVATTVTLLLAGCGSDESPNSGSTSSGASSFDPTTIAEDPAISALVPEAVASTGKLIVASDTTYAPAEYIGEDGQTPEGYDVDLAKAIGAVLGLETEVQTASFTGIIPAIGSKYDIGVSSFTITPEREAEVNMIQYFSAGEAYAVAKGNPKNVDASDLCGLTVGVQTGTVEDEALDALVAQCAADGKDPITPLKYDKQTDVTTALVGGKADIMYADSPIIAYAVAQTGGQAEQLGEVFATSPQGVVVSQGDPALTEAVQQAIQKLIDSGNYLTILTAWGNEDSAVTTAELNPSVG